MAQDTHIPPDGETANDNLPNPAPNPRYVRIMLTVVIGLGVLLVVGTAVVVGTIIKRASSTETAVVTDMRDKAIAGQIAIPAGAVLQSVENGDTRIVLHLTDAEGTLLILLDPRHGFETGRVRLVSQ